MIEKSETRSRAFFLILLGWFVYSSSYLGKVNYSANITQIIDFYGITKSQAGIVPTFFFFSYGIGQVFNGILCKKYNIKWMIFISLCASACINLIIAISTDFSIIKWLWMVNGFVLSILWPTLVRLLAEALPQRVLGISSIIMGTTVASGTLVIYALSSLFVAFGKFKLSFYTAGIVVLVASVIWLLCYDKMVSVSKKEKESEDTVTEQKTEGVEITKEKFDRRLLTASVYSLCFFAVVVNLIKDGLTTWVPSILKEEFFVSDSLSILLTMFLPVLAIFGNATALNMHKKIPDYVNHCFVVFAAISIVIFMIIGSLIFELIAFMFIGLVAANFFASSLNSLITSIFPMFMREKVNSGLYAGILNGFCYLGSAISSYGLGVIADMFGWSAVFFVLVGFCFISFLVWGVYAYLKHSFKKSTR